MMMTMTMKKRPIGKSSQTSTGAAFIDWCFKSGNKVAYMEVLFNIIKPSPHHVQMKNKYALKPVRETYPIFSAQSTNLEKGQKHVSCDCNSDSNTFSCEENLHRDEKYRCVETSSIVW